MLVQIPKEHQDLPHHFNHETSYKFKNNLFYRFGDVCKVEM